ncbi:MAG: DUF2304 family protein [Thermodesulfovibrionales bacterium]
MDIIQIISVAVSGSIFFVVFELIRRNHLKERYSLVWLAAMPFLAMPFQGLRGNV